MNELVDWFITHGPQIGLRLGGALLILIAGQSAAGFMLLLYRPYDIGDVIEASGASGIVKGMNLVNTTMQTEDGTVVTIANGKIWGGVIKNKGRTAP